MRYVLVWLCVMMMAGLSAQTKLRMTPAVAYRQAVLPNDANHEEVLKVEVTNTTRQTLRLRWDREVVYQPNAWVIQLCDKESSYPPEVSSNYNPLQGIAAPIVLAPGESFDLYLTVAPFRVTGQNKVEVVFRNMDNPSETLGTAVFQLNLLDSRTKNDIESAGNRIRVYPNPVYDRFFLQNAPPLSKLEVYNTLGRKVKSWTTPLPGDSFFAGDLPQGVYLLSLVDEQGQVIRTIRMVKREFRP
ncbi:MAG: T9SS type A sorting domain-containing protein [Saprospiraceae bacterium]